MKKSIGILWILSTLIANKILAQSDTFYVNDKGICLSPKEASAYRVVMATESNRYLLKEYLLNHKLVKVFHAANARANILDGAYTEIDELGNVVSKGTYCKGFKTGEWCYFYAQSNRIREKRFFSAEDAYKSYQYDSTFQKIHKKGIVDKYGKRQGEWIQYHNYSDSIKKVSNYLNGKREGPQLEYFLNGQLKRKELCRNNKIIKGKMYDEEGKKLKYFPEFTYPQYKEYLSNYLQKSEPCVSEVLRLGDFMVSIVIAKNGAVIEASVTNIQDPFCAEKIRAALLKMKKWKPALYENEPIKNTFESIVRLYAPKD